MSITKITPPRANNLVPRQRLFQRLDDLCEIPVVWLVGPPGAGKTTLVNSYLSQHAVQHLWFQLDEGDASIATFFHYFRVAVLEVVPDCRKELPALTPEYLLGLTTFVRRYAEIIGNHLKKPTVIVLDNYEELPVDATLHTVVVKLASCLPPDVRLFILSRAEPPPAFARLFLHGQLSLLEGVPLCQNSCHPNKIPKRAKEGQQS